LKRYWENPTYGILEREEETYCMDWRLFATQLETVDILEATILNTYAPCLYSVLSAVKASVSQGEEVYVPCNMSLI
jgi:hypothetical protein